MMKTLTIAAAEYLYALVVAGAGVFFLRQTRVGQKEMILFALRSVPLTLFLAFMAGYFYVDPRPFVVGNFTPLIPHAPDNGFPSDHALLCFSVSALVFCFDKRWGVVLGILGLLVGIARVAAGIHHPIDIMGSAGIAFFCAFVVLQGRKPRSLR